MTTERQNSLAVSKLYPNHYNQNNVENRASYYEFGLFADIIFIDNIIEIQYNDITNVMSESNICCEFYLIPKIYFAFVFVVDVYWVLFCLWIQIHAITIAGENTHWLFVHLLVNFPDDVSPIDLQGVFSSQ